MLTKEEILDAAAEWLETQFPGNFRTREEWVILTLTQENYPTGWTGFVEDTNLAHAVS